MNEPRLDSSFIYHWAAVYEKRLGPTALEVRLLDDVGPRIRERGWVEIEDLLEIVRWKSPRSKSRAAANAADDVKDITALAARAPDHLRHRVLGLLQGVGTPVASAVLTVWWPDRYTVTDFRALGSLSRLLDDTSVKAISYSEYVQLCRDLAERHADGDLRRMDRALWEWSKQDYPTNWTGGGQG